MNQQIQSVQRSSWSARSTPTRSDAERAAEELYQGFLAHDERDQRRAHACFSAVDECQFPHLNASDVRRAADAYVEALWEKDRAELPSQLTDSDVDHVRWERVETSLRRRADIVGMDEQYATNTAKAWKQHALGGKYRTPLMIAKLHEIHAMIGMDGPETSLGESGLGYLVSRYLVGIEVHSRHDDPKRQQVAVMTPYFESIGRCRERQ